jgi:hypothetical protein
MFEFHQTFRAHAKAQLSLLLCPAHLDFPWTEMQADKQDEGNNDNTMKHKGSKNS